MKRALLVLLAGCPSDPSGNSTVLWLAPDRNETAVKLVGSEPHPY